MLVQFDTRDFGAFLTNFERACAYTEMILNPPSSSLTMNPEGILNEAIPRYHEALLGLMQVILNGKVKLSQSVGLQIGRLSARLTAGGPFNHAALSAEARLIRQLLVDDLAQHVFVTVSAEYREFFEQKEPPFGVDVANEFGDARRDIEAACRCMALNEWTASVFHSMRVLEHGLRPVAVRFNVPFEVDSWHTVLRGIEDGIATLRNRSQRALTEADRREITYYSELANEFRYFKDAWRNHVSHAREHYDERDAAAVLAHVRHFMQQLAKGV